MASVPQVLPTTPEEVEVWLLNNFTTFDALEVALLGNIFANDGELQFANNPVIRGLDTIKENFVHSYAALAYMKHVPRSFDKVENRIWLTTQISYRIKGDPQNVEITIPASALATLVTEGDEAGKMAKFQVFLDNKPILDRIEAVAALQAESQSLPRA
ncbi:uncharacterized protein CTRU02_204092 [Colletotrichum truncatum]|uniref:Uncharacterized protein n=1 Tax=Colletotrichum truncatum TaxID=5467 RepID=A0ACC3ZB41_COLTU|nr:uncharacterized protein CTRU02_09945 [Colletotrichum truncatum]KAF6787650.1 hypothetical protein CTRU02_09945 [Colletotrichum truncatum]